jgi:pteridine reductase
MSSPNSLENHVALITGAARRIGAAIARTLHAQGADVAIHYRGSAEEAADLTDELNSQRADSATSYAADLTDMAGLNTLVEDVVAWRSRLDILVNNASSFYPTPVGEITEDQWDDLIGTNLKAPLFLSQAAVPSLREARGVIINIVDVHSQRPLRDHTVYGPSKAGLAMLTRSLAKDLAPEVRVNGVSPGAILWPENGMSGATKDAILEQVPLGRPGTPDDVANAVLFLAKDADYVTGQIIAIDGGRSIGW